MCGDVAQGRASGSDAGSPALTVETTSGEAVEVTDEAMAAAETLAGFEELPEFSENTSLDGPAGLDQDLAAAGDAMPAAIDPTTGTLEDAASMPDFGDLAWGTHVCQFFRTAEDLAEVELHSADDRVQGGCGKVAMN